MKFKQAQWCKAYHAILRESKLTIGARLTLVLLRSYCGLSKDKCWPSTERLCRDLGCNRKSLTRYLAELDKNGCIRRKRWRLKNSVFTSTHYTLLDERKAITISAFPQPKKGAVDRIEESPDCKYITSKQLQSKIIDYPQPKKGATK